MQEDDAVPRNGSRDTQGSPAGGAVPVTARRPGGRRHLQSKGNPMTAAPCDQSADEDQEATGRLRELHRELDLWGIVTCDLGAGMPASVLNRPGTRCEIGSRAPGDADPDLPAPGKGPAPVRGHLADAGPARRQRAVDAGRSPGPGPQTAAGPRRQPRARQLRNDSRASTRRPPRRGDRGAADLQSRQPVPGRPDDQRQARTHVGMPLRRTWQRRPGSVPSDTARAIAAALAVLAAEPR